jgi:ADP-heptose:LPS heptosyltransferase
MLVTPDKILLIKHGAFGDLVQSDGVLRDIRQFYPQAEIVLLTGPSFQSLMQQCPHIDRIITDARAPFWQLPGQFKLAGKLRREQFTQVIDLQNSDRSRLYQRLIFKNTKWIGRLSGPEPESGLKGLITLLEEAGIPVEHALNPDVSWMADDVSTLLAQDNVRTPFIALIPGCSASHPHKRWPFYAELAQALIDHGYDVVSTIGPDELDLADLLPGHTLIKQKGLLNWFELAGVLQQASFVIGNDTGPSHVASCLGKPGLALFGSQTSVARAEIRRGLFRALKVNDLNQLSVETVLSDVLPKLPAPSPHLAIPRRRPSYLTR